jgi:hypothetical protein
MIIQIKPLGTYIWPFPKTSFVSVHELSPENKEWVFNFQPSPTFVFLFSHKTGLLKHVQLFKI